MDEFVAIDNESSHVFKEEILKKRIQKLYIIYFFQIRKVTLKISNMNKFLKEKMFLSTK